jgi:hypothetical protein
MKNEKLEKAFESLPKKNLGLVTKPFSGSGNHKQAVTLFSMFLTGKPKSKVDLLINSGILKKSVEDVNIGSYYSTCFSTLSKIGAIRYNTIDRTYSRGDSFQDYFEYLIGCMKDSPAKEKLHSLLSKEQITRLEKNLHEVALEMLQDKLTMKTLRRMWRGDKTDVVGDFILNIDDE